MNPFITMFPSCTLSKWCKLPIILLLTSVQLVQAQTDAQSKILLVKAPPGYLHTDDSLERVDHENRFGLNATHLGNRRVQLLVFSEMEPMNTVAISYFNRDGIRIHHFEKVIPNAPANKYQVILKFPEHISPLEVVKLNVNGWTSFYKVLEL